MEVRRLRTPKMKRMARTFRAILSTMNLSRMLTRPKMAALRSARVAQSIADGR